MSIFVSGRSQSPPLALQCPSGELNSWEWEVIVVMTVESSFVLFVYTRFLELCNLLEVLTKTSSEMRSWTECKNVNLEDFFKSKHMVKYFKMCDENESNLEFQSNCWKISSWKFETKHLQPRSDHVRHLRIIPPCFHSFIHLSRFAFFVQIIHRRKVSELSHTSKS